MMTDTDRQSIKATNETLRDLILTECYEKGWDTDLNHIDVSEVTDMSDLFSKPPYKVFTGDISKWDVSNVKNMSNMFAHSEFNSDISTWNTANVTDMHSMFEASKFNKDISNWDVSNVKNMSKMFYFSEFNQDISNWNTKNVSDMSLMFYGSEFNKNISGWDISNNQDTTEMFGHSKYEGDFSKHQALQQDLDNPSTREVTKEDEDNQLTPEQMQQIQAEIISLLFQGDSRPNDVQIETSHEADTDIDTRSSEIPSGAIPDPVIIQANNMRGFQTLTKSKQLFVSAVASIANKVIQKLDHDSQEKIKRNFHENMEKAMADPQHIKVPKEIQEYIDKRFAEIDSCENTVEYDRQRRLLEEQKQALARAENAKEANIQDPIAALATKAILDLNYEKPPSTLKSRLDYQDGHYVDIRSLQAQFEDRGNKLKTVKNDWQTAQDMIEVAKAKNWNSIKLSGTADFKRAAWLAAESQGILTSGYIPTREDRLALKTLIEQRNTNQIEPTVHDKPEPELTL